MKVFEVFRLQFNILKFMGMSQSRSSSWLYRIYGIFIHVAFIDFFTLFHVFYFFHFEGIQDLMDCIGTFLTNFGQVVKTLNWMANLKKIKESLKNLEELVKISENGEKKDRKKLEKYVARGNLYFKLLLVSAIASCILAGLVPLFNLQEHKLAYRMHFPFLDYKKNDKIFILCALYQMSPVFICTVTISLDFVPVMFMCVATGIVKELSDRMEKIGKSAKSEEEATEKLLKCVEIQLKIKKVVVEIQENFSGVILVQLLLSSVIFCSNAFMLSLVSPLKDTSVFMRLVSYSIPMVVQIFMPCFYGNELKVETLKLSKSLFHSQWIDQGFKFKKAMKIVMENLKHPTEVLLFGVIKVNLNSFTSVCNFAYSLYAVFQRVNN